jgi:exodeoxyribonuclease VII large subunit
MSELVLSVSDFVAVFNQTIDYAYPLVSVQGELADFRVSKNRWVYFDLKDEFANVKFFGTVYQLSGPLEDGMMMQVSGQPRLHPLYGFSINIQSLQPIGEGSLKRAAALLEAKLRQEGLFDDSRKRVLPYPPRRIGLIASHESAAYHDFIKILNSRWGGLEILHTDVQVQGELAPEQLLTALDYFNTYEDPVDVIIMTRGGGSSEDLAAFSSEQVTRAVAASRIPTLVAIGHEIDISLAELAADVRASTPSNAAELLVPDKRSELERLKLCQNTLLQFVNQSHERRVKKFQDTRNAIEHVLELLIEDQKRDFSQRKAFLQALNPQAILSRGYAIVRSSGKVIRSAKQAKSQDTLRIQLRDGEIQAEVK